MEEVETKEERALRWQRARESVVPPTPKQILAWQEAGGRFAVIKGGKEDGPGDDGGASKRAIGGR